MSSLAYEGAECGLVWPLKDYLSFSPRMHRSSVPCSLPPPSLPPFCPALSNSAIRLSQEHGSVDRAYALNQMSAEWDALWEGENLQIGLQAFAERKTPQWIPSKL